MSPAKLPLPDPSPAQPAGPPTPTMVVSVSECGRVAFREWVAEPSAVAFALVHGQVAQGHFCPLRIAEPPTPAMAAVIAELGLVAFQEQALEPPASAGTAFTGDHAPAPMVSVRKQVVA
ncbi:hypothetical protein ACFVYA_13010 [Amycolatopsis sp. NPDC058278]|uniref:hypothetical protein n=1 Tax=Amycolatopsis sp. NPDC058278 TaxID=3346417 RepID=UPI0036DCED96